MPGYISYRRRRMNRWYRFGYFLGRLIVLALVAWLAIMMIAFVSWLLG